MHKAILNITLPIMVLCFDVGADEQGAADTQNIVFARINDLTITAIEFESIFSAAVRHKYYHGRVPENELVKFRQKVTEDIVTQVIVIGDAKKQGLEPNHEKIAKGIDEYSSKYANSPEWQNQRDQVIPLLKKRLERQNLLEKMELRIRDITQPPANEIAEYYRQHPQKFTEPKRIWGSVILVTVEPSASMETWTEAFELAQQLKFRVENGEDYAVLAKQYSGHASAINGGDLGYLHQGMLNPDVQEKVEALAISETSDPMRILEGVILFRVNGVQPQKIKPFDEVRQRTAELLYRQLQDKAWDNYVYELKASASIYINKQLSFPDNHE
jgi:parvulin-like peptidyl-prolyl isomerase